MTDRPSKHVILRYHKDSQNLQSSNNTISSSNSSLSPSSAVSSATSSPGSNSPISSKPFFSEENNKLNLISSDPLDIQVAPAYEYIEKLYSYSLDQDDEWKETANKVLEILQPLRLRWKELETNRKALARTVAASARASRTTTATTATNNVPGQVVKRGPGRPTGWRKRPVVPPPSISSGTSSGGEGNSQH